MTLSYEQVEVETLEPFCYDLVFGWEAVLAHYEGEVLPRLYRKTKQGYRWQLWGMGELEWISLNQHLASGEEVVLDLQTVRKLLGLYRYAKDWGINTSGLLQVFYQMSVKDCPCYRVWLGEQVEWRVEEEIAEDSALTHETSPGPLTQFA